MFHVIEAPLRVPQSQKKDFILNMNVYRNAHFRTLHKVKIEYKYQVTKQIIPLPEMTKVAVTYMVYPATARKGDLMNVACIHSKFFLDALVELGKIPDDTYDVVIKETVIFGEIDRANPRVSIIIENLSHV